MALIKTITTPSNNTYDLCDAEARRHVVWYGECDTGASTVTKVVSCGAYVDGVFSPYFSSLYNGLCIRIRFNYGQTAAGPKLNVNSIGEKEIKRLSYTTNGGSTYVTTSEASGSWVQGETVDFVYDLPNDAWMQIDAGHASTSTWGITKLSNAADSSDATLAATPYAVRSAYRRGIEYIQSTQGVEVDTPVWTGVTTSSALYVGKTIAYYFQSSNNSTSGVTLNLTLSGGTTTGDIPIYINDDTPLTNQFDKGSIIILTYTGSNWRVSKASQDNDTYDRVQLNALIKVAADIQARSIIVGTTNGYKPLTAGVGFDLSYPILLAGAAMTSGEWSRDGYLAHPNGSVGVIASTAGIDGTDFGLGKMLYLKGRMSSGLFVPVASPCLSCALPTTDDGYYYIPIALVNQVSVIYFISSSQLYAYHDGAFGPVVTYLEELIDSMSNYASFLGVTTTALSDGSGTNPITINGVSVTADAGDIVIYGKKEFIFNGSTNKWASFGEINASELGDLAYVDQTTASYTPGGTVNVYSWTSQPQGLVTSTYKPAGSVAVTPTTDSVYSVTRLASFSATVNDENLTLSWTAPTRAEKTVATGIQSATFTGTNSYWSASFNGHASTIVADPKTGS